MMTELYPRNRPVYDGMRNFRTSQIELRQRLEGRERDWVVVCLLAKRGVHDVAYRDGDPRQLVVEYDADQLSGAELVNFLYVCGLPVRPFAAED